MELVCHCCQQYCIISYNYVWPFVLGLTEELISYWNIWQFAVLKKLCQTKQNHDQPYVQAYPLCPSLSWEVLVLLVHWCQCHIKGIQYTLQYTSSSFSSSSPYKNIILDYLWHLFQLFTFWVQIPWISTWVAHLSIVSFNITTQHFWVLFFWDSTLLLPAFKPGQQFQDTLFPPPPPFALSSPPNGHVKIVFFPAYKISPYSCRVCSCLQLWCSLLQLKLINMF